MNVIDNIKNIDRMVDYEYNQKIKLYSILTGLVDIFLYAYAFSNNQIIPCTLAISSLNVGWINLINKMITDKTKLKDEQIVFLLKNTEEYDELMCEYKKLIDAIVIYLKDKNFKDSKDILLYLNLMLKTGLFSLPTKYKIGNFNEQIEFLTEILGTHVTSGMGVCRHEATFFYDVLSEYGYDIYKIGLFKQRKGIKDYIRPDEDFNIKHLIVGIKDDVCYDPTNDLFYSKIENRMISESLYKEYFIDKKGTNLYNTIPGSYETICSMNFNNLSKEELKQLRFEITNYFYSETSANIDFAMAIREKVAKVYKLSYKLSPFSNDKIVDWKLEETKKTSI